MQDLTPPVSDARLLASWREHQDEEALAQLCRRHSGMVRASCLRLRATDTEEAVQAVFVILSRKAGAIGDADRLAGWLVGTARHVVAHQRRAHARRLRHEREAAVLQRSITQADGAGAGGAGWDEARDLLDEALGRLSPGRREAVIRFYLQGQPQAEVAAELGCSVDAVKTRIHEGLTALRAFFARRGLSLGLTVLISGLATEAKAAEPSLSALGLSPESMPAPTPGAQALAGEVQAAGGWTSFQAAGTGPLWWTAAGLLLAGGAAALVLSAGGEEAPGEPAMPAPQARPADRSMRLFQEGFEDAGFRARGWYDNADFPCVSRGTGRAVAFRFRAGDPLPGSGGPARLLFAPCDDLRIRCRIAYDTGWDASTSMVQMLVLTTADDRYAAPSDCVMSCGIGVTRGAYFVSCLDALAAVADGTAPLRRHLIPGGIPTGSWHGVEARFRMNRIVAGRVVADGLISFSVDGRELFARSDVVFRTLAQPDMRFNQFILGPYASISPGDQTLWMDDLELASFAGAEPQAKAP